MGYILLVMLTDLEIEKSKYICFNIYII